MYIFCKGNKKIIFPNQPNPNPSIPTVNAIFNF